MRMNRQAQLQLVRQTLDSYSGKKRRTDRYTMICCPFHADNTPSGMIYHGEDTYKPGNFKCLGCGTKCNWNELAERLNWTPFTGIKPEDQYITALRSLEPPKDEEKKSTKFYREPLPKGRSWRGFSTEYLTSVGAELGVYDWGGQFVYLPVVVNRKKRGYIRAAIRKGSGPSYLNKRGVWSKQHGLFLFDHSVRLMRDLGSRTLVLVEGPRDALRLHRFGIPAVSILGTQTWTRNKAWHLERAGVDQVILLFDGDPAGKKAVELVTPDLEQVVGSVFVFPLWGPDSPYPEWKSLDPEQQKARKGELWDPGNCPTSVLRKLKVSYYKE